MSNEPMIAPDLPTLTPEQKENVIALYRKAGFNEDKIAAAFGTTPPLKPPTGEALKVGDQPGQASPPANDRQRSTYSQSLNLQYEQKVAGLNLLLKHGANPVTVLQAACRTPNYRNRNSVSPFNSRTHRNIFSAFGQ